MTSLNGARKKAQDASFQGAASSVQATAIICCDTSGAALKVQAAGATGGDVCNPSTNVPGVYAATIDQVEVLRTCTDAAGWQLKMHSQGKGTVATMTCTETGCQ
jgi:hypothetical protein